ncbi:MAG: nucleotidyl transferase AbiEii/AbiGii toxin family protein [Verrucomicrobiota bacterium]
MRTSPSPRAKGQPKHCGRPDSPCGIPPHSINAELPGSRLRIQITINSRYGAFPSRAVTGTLFGVELPIASLADVVQGKLWAATDPDRRRSKRAKDELDIMRLAELHPEILALFPAGLLPRVDELRTES